MLGRTADNGGLCFVDVDVEAGVETAVAQLVEGGHQRIAFLHEDARAYATASRALQAYERACARRRIRLATPACQPSAAGGFAAAQVLLGQEPDISALVVWSEAAALGALRAARDAGRQVPHDLSLVCIGAALLGDLFELEPACVGLRFGEQARQAAAMLLDILGGAAYGDRQVLLEPTWSPGRTIAAKGSG
jgi:LacI family transcriptional regulator